MDIIKKEKERKLTW